MLSVRAATLAAFVGLALMPALAQGCARPHRAGDADAPPHAARQPAAGHRQRRPRLRPREARCQHDRDDARAGPGDAGDRRRPDRQPDPGRLVLTVPTGQLHPTGQPVSIRGFGSSTTINTLVMVDGVPINDPYFRTVDWSRISKNSVERIEVIRGGGATSLWGNMAMGGVINIVTRQPTRTGVCGRRELRQLQHGHRRGRRRAKPSTTRSRSA